MPDEAAAFDALEDEFFSVWFRYHPDVAAEVGVRGFERFLPAQSDDELSALGAWLETLVVALEELDYTALDPDRQLDLRLMFGAARVEHQEMLERDWRYRDPLRYLPVGEIYHLILQPPTDIRDVLAALLGAIPEHLRLALSRLRSMAELVAPALVTAAVDEAERGRCYLRDLASNQLLRRNCYSFSEIESLADAACGALATYGDALQNEIAARAAGCLGCGQDHLRFLFKHRHFMDLVPLRARAELDDALGCCEDELAALCASSGVAPDGIWQYLRSRAVKPSLHLNVCRKESDRLARLLGGAGFVSLPEADLHISWRPACPRPQRLGTDYMADREQRRGTYFPSVPPSNGGGGEALACVRARCMDKTWSGSHLLAFAAGDAGWRLPRRLCEGASLIGAWRSYVRERLTDLGHLETDDRLLALIQRRDAIRRGLLDLDLHAGDVTDEEATARLEGIPGCDESTMIHLARRPGDSLAAVLGWMALTRTRKLAEDQEGCSFSEGAFHDRLLSSGPVPLQLILDTKLG